MKNPRRWPGGAATGTQGTGVRSHPASARYSKNLAARAELNQIPSGFFNPQPLGSPLGGSLIMRSGHCWRATCRCANNARSCSSRGGKLSGQPFLTIGGGGGAFPFPLPRPAQPETLTATRELQPKRTTLSSLEVPFLHAQRCTSCLAPPLVAPLA